MFNKDIIDFFKRHNLYDKEMFSYIFASQSEPVDYFDSDVNFTIGCRPKLDRLGRIEGFSLTLPYCWDDVTTLVCIHEIAHAIYFYKKHGTKYKPGEIELFPMIVERLFLEENYIPAREDTIERITDGSVCPGNEEQQEFARDNIDKAMQGNISNFPSISRTTRRLYRKWKFKRLIG